MARTYHPISGSYTCTPGCSCRCHLVDFLSTLNLIYGVNKVCPPQIHSRMNNEVHSSQKGCDTHVSVRIPCIFCANAHKFVLCKNYIYMYIYICASLYYENYAVVCVKWFQSSLYTNDIHSKTSTRSFSIEISCNKMFIIP